MKWDPQKQDWVEAYDPMPAHDHPRSTRAGLYVAIAVVVVGVIASVVLLNIVGEGTDPGRASVAAVNTGSIPGGTPSPAPPLDEAPYEEGLSEAVAHVIATEPDPQRGGPRIDTILSSLSLVTGGRCSASSPEVETFHTRRRALEEFDVVRAVQYAPPHWKDQFIGVRVEVTCS